MPKLQIAMNKCKKDQECCVYTVKLYFNVSNKFNKMTIKESICIPQEKSE